MRFDSDEGEEGERRGICIGKTSGYFDLFYGELWNTTGSENKPTLVTYKSDPAYVLGVF